MSIKLSDDVDLRLRRHRLKRVLQVGRDVVGRPLASAAC